MCWKLFWATLRRGYTWGLFWRGLTRPSANISVTFQATPNAYAYIINHCLAVLRKFLGDFWAFWERDIFSVGIGEIEENMKCWRFDGIWREELADGHQTVPYQPGALFWGVNCLVVFPTYFNPNNSLLIITSNFTPIHVYPALSGIF